MLQPMSESLAVSMGARIKELRESRAWSQRDLAARAALPQNRLSKYETGARQAPLAALVRIARALTVPVDALLPDTGDAPTPDSELLGRVKSLMALGAEEKAVACSLLDTVLAMRQLRTKRT